MLRGALETAAGPIAADTLTARFKRAQTDRVAELLETLVIVSQLVSKTAKELGRMVPQPRGRLTYA